MAEEVQVTTYGPLFNGSAAAQSDAFLRDAIHMVAEAAKREVDHNLADSIRHPSSPPYYQSQINVARRDAAEVVNDSMVIYGPWLEGVGSRNATTRFKGYSSFRRAKQEIARKVPALVQPALAAFLARLR